MLTNNSLNKPHLNTRCHYVYQYVCNRMRQRARRLRNQTDMLAWRQHHRCILSSSCASHLTNRICVCVVACTAIALQHNTKPVDEGSKFQVTSLNHTNKIQDLLSFCCLSDVIRTTMPTRFSCLLVVIATYLRLV